MADWLKIAIKAGIVITIMASLIGILTMVKVPAVDWSIFSQLGLFFGVLNHYLPVFKVLWPLLILVVSIEIAFITTHFVLIAIKWVMKVNE